jgi:hypothetical protein
MKPMEDESQYVMDKDETKHTHSEHADTGLEIEATNLPANYYKSVYFWGSMCAAGSSFAAVRTTPDSFDQCQVTK